MNWSQVSRPDTDTKGCGTGPFNFGKSSEVGDPRLRNRLGEKDDARLVSFWCIEEAESIWPKSQVGMMISIWG